MNVESTPTPCENNPLLHTYNDRHEFNNGNFCGSATNFCKRYDCDCSSAILPHFIGLLSGTNGMSPLQLWLICRLPLVSSILWCYTGPDPTIPMYHQQFVVICISNVTCHSLFRLIRQQEFTKVNPMTQTKLISRSCRKVGKLTCEGGSNVEVMSSIYLYDCWVTCPRPTQ